MMSSRFLSLSFIALAAIGLSACSSTANRATSDQQGSSISQTGERIDNAFKKALAEAEKSGNPQTVISVIDPYFRRHKDDPYIAARYARALREDNQLNSARNILAPFTKGEKANAEALTEMAMTQLALGNYKEAEIAARKATELEKDAGRAHLALGTALDAQGNYAEAEKSFRTGLKVWRGDAAPILNNLALNLASQGNFEQALDILDRARREYPNRTELERNFRIISTLHDTNYHPAARPAKPEKKANAQEAEVEPAAGSKQAPATVKKDKIVEKVKSKIKPDEAEAEVYIEPETRSNLKTND